jgi:Cdc6-like AAA superfamily ATPase
MNKSDTKIKIVLIDELDYLVTKDEQVLYNLFEWTQNKHSKLVLITIANTLNLP